MGYIARIHLTPPPSSSCEVERLFSTASEILNKRRNRLLPSNAEKLLFVHENMAKVEYQWHRIKFMIRKSHVNVVVVIMNLNLT